MIFYLDNELATRQRAGETWMCLSVCVCVCVCAIVISFQRERKNKTQPKQEEEEKKKQLRENWKKSAQIWKW